ncbi:hypothetical protein [Halostreptopolyspora alba]|uniref:Uncharacterized protein n=1 Tax=Halostreptopolyspora alba TaxID=2487137 RepID=A0A3N0DRF7_9ACTN|nr:hypothetical protein EFW17_23295 [Nocardiopsaceae bacterium YIM 96095]
MHEDTSPPFRVVAPEAVVADAVDAGYQPPVPRVRALATGDRPVLVRCHSPASDGGWHGQGAQRREELAETLALVSVYAWAGARLFATSHPHAAGQALDMVASIRGTRPPAVARRGLA